MLKNNLPMSCHRVQQFQEAIKNDKVLSKVYYYCMNGWPESIKDVTSEINQYFRFKNYLYALDILLLNDRIVVPSLLKDSMI